MPPSSSSHSKMGGEKIVAMAFHQRNMVPNYDCFSEQCICKLNLNLQSVSVHMHVVSHQDKVCRSDTATTVRHDQKYTQPPSSAVSHGKNIRICLTAYTMA